MCYRSASKLPRFFTIGCSRSTQARAACSPIPICVARPVSSWLQLEWSCMLSTRLNQWSKTEGAGTPARQLRGREQALCDGRRRTPVDAAGWAGRSLHPGASRRVGVRLQYAQRNDDGGGHGSVVDPCNNKLPWAAGRGPSRDAWVRKNKTARVFIGNLRKALPKLPNCEGARSNFLNGAHRSPAHEL